MTTESQGGKFWWDLHGVLIYDPFFSDFIFSDDNTQTGYSLGMPEGRSTVPSPERGLSQAACCIVRALMHSALLWASCNNEVQDTGLEGKLYTGTYNNY